MGYAGGTTLRPTYRSMGDHAETVQIDFDPDRISYGELLEFFGSRHDPLRRSWSRQYASLILYHTDAQRREAEAWKERAAKERGREPATEIIPFGGFTLAEDFHQKHSLRLFPEFFDAMRAFYPSVRELVDSTAAARINGYVDGYGECAVLDNELNMLGLPGPLQERLRELVCGASGRPGAACPLPRAR